VLQVQEEQVSVLFFSLSLSLSRKLSFPLGSFSSVCPDFFSPFWLRTPSWCYIRFCRVAVCGRHCMVGVQCLVSCLHVCYGGVGGGEGNG